MIIREIFEILQEEDLLSWHPVFKWINEKKKKNQIIIMKSTAQQLL